MTLGNYQIEKFIAETDDISFYIVSDSGQQMFIIRKVSKQDDTDVVTNAWFQCYEDYQLNITNFNFLPKILTVSTIESGAYTLFPYEPGTLLKDNERLTLTQLEQLLEAVRHLHKKGITHGNIHEETIWLRENGNVLLFGTSEQRIFSPNATISKQSDYEAIFAILTKFTHLDLSTFKGKTPSSLEEIQQFIQGVQVKPGLVEKEVKVEKKPAGLVEKETPLSENEIPTREHENQFEEIKATLTPVVDLREKKRESKKKPNKWRRRIGWFFGSIAAVFVLLFIIGVVTSEDDVASISPIEEIEEQPEEEIIEETGPEETKPPEMTSQEISSLFPGWESIKQEIVSINGHYFTILGMGQISEEDWGSVKVAVVDYDVMGKQWERIWESEQFASDPFLDVKSFIGDFIVKNPLEQKSALVVFNIMHGGSSGVYEVQAIEVNEEGNGNPFWQGSGYHIDQNGDQIIVYHLGETHFTTENNKFMVNEITRTELAPADAVKANFMINTEGFVEGTDGRELYIKVGQTLAFHPMNEDVKRKFNEGAISIYTNLTDGEPADTSNASLSRGGNEFEFPGEGVYEFILEYYDGTASGYVQPPATFVVHVGDGKKPPETVRKNETSLAVSTPFQLGDDINDVLDYYGQPSYDDYYLGGRLVLFEENKVGYFWDEGTGEVTGFYIFDPTITIYGASVGMTGQEINSIYPVSTEPSLDESESDSYIHSYYIENYKIFYHSEDPYGPTSYVLVLNNN